MDRSSTIRRSAAAVLFALLLAVRLLSPAGFMPAFDHGAISITVCPDGEPAPAPMAHHHHHGEAKLQQHCPYAAGAAPATAAELALVVAAVLAIALLLVGRPFQSIRHRRLQDRPPLRGPPVPA
jgi:UDP-N-acetylmuramyl pentapeptide phosphotransferase/UDP-N-acetylglucosamine-1-phosphate transferase